MCSRKSLQPIIEKIAFCKVAFERAVFWLAQIDLLIESLKCVIKWCFKNEAKFTYSPLCFIKKHHINLIQTHDMFFNYLDL